MAIFDFGKKQRLHAQLVGHTSGNEMFKVDEYNQRKNTTFGCGFVLVLLFTVFYFAWNYIPTKILVFLCLIFIGVAAYGYYNFQQQRRLREKLY